MTSAKKEVIEAVLELLADIEPDFGVAMGAMLSIAARLAIDTGMEVTAFGMLAEAIEQTMEIDDRQEAGARLQ